ncbi:hypothetical protein [Mesorhizobium ciceri]
MDEATLESRGTSLREAIRLLSQIDGVERPRYRQHLSARTWSLRATPQG